MYNDGGDRRLLDYVFKGCADLIDRNARQSDLRNAYADLMAANKWVNRDIDGLVNAIVESLPALERLFARGNEQLADWIDAAIASMVDGHFAGIVLKSKVANDLDRNTYDEMRRAANGFIDVCKTAQRGGGGGRDGGFNRGDDRGSARAVHDIGAVGNYRGGNERGTEKASLDDGWSEIARARQAVTDVVEHVDDRPETPRYQEEQVRQSPIFREPERPDTVIEGPDYTKADPWREFWKQGEHWQIAHHSNWKLTVDPDADLDDGIKAIPSFYNINTHLKYYVKNESGEVREELIPVNDDNKYQAHQLLSSQDESFKPPVRSAGMSLNPRRVTEQADEMPSNNIAEAPVPALDLVTVLATLSEEALVPSGDKTLITDSMSAAVFSARAKLLREDASASVELSFMRTPVMVKGADQVDQINRIFESPTMMAAANAMNDSKHLFEPNLWHVLNGRITSKLHHATRYAFSYDGLSSKVKFAEHFDKVLQHVEGKRGKEWAAAYAARVKYVLASACGHLNHEDLSDGLSGLGDMTGLNAVVFSDYQVVIALDHTLDQLGLGKALSESPMGLSVSASEHPRLHAALLRVYKKLDDTYAANHLRVVLSTSDNQLVEIVPYSARTSSFVLVLI